MKYLILAVLLVSVSVSAEVIVIPSDYEDYSYSEQKSFVNDGYNQRKDQTFSDAVHESIYLEEDMALDGYFADEYENDGY